jgi:MipA family protein
MVLKTRTSFDFGRLTGATLLSLALFLPHSAHATDPSGPGSPEDASASPSDGSLMSRLSDWEVFIGGGAMYAPKFEGSNDLAFVPLPMVSVTFGDLITVDPMGLEVHALNHDGFKLDVKGGYDFMGGRKDSDSSHLRGLGDIKSGAVLGAKASYEIGPMEFYASIDKTFGGSDGLVGVAGLNLSHNIDQFMLSAGASATFADENHMESYFGVTAAQSANSGLAEYDADAGIKRFDIEASVTYMVNQNWMVRGQAGLGFLAGDAKNSPIVQDEMQPSAMLMLGYRF